jgi:hemoglobin/transferrin/lactoferrin receptor protein
MPNHPPFARRPWLALLLLSPCLAAEPTPTELDAITITATRSEQPLDQVPSTVSVHTERDIDRHNMKSIKDLVRYEPGVSVSGTGSRFGLSGFSIRGIDGNRVLTQVDGVGVPAAFAFGPFLDARRNYVDLDSVKRVEILRGPASSLYGSDAIGGAVSFLTKDAADYLEDGDDLYARLKTGYDGSDDSWQRSATFAIRQGRVDGLLHLGRRDGQALDTHGGNSGSGAGREQANPLDYRTDNLLAKLGWDYAEGGRLQFTYERYEDRADARLRSEEGGLSSIAIGGPMRSNSLIESFAADDSTERERFSLEQRLQLDSPLADRLYWQLSRQGSETRQRSLQDRTTWVSMGAPSLPPPPSATLRQRSRNSLYDEQLWAFNTQLDKAFSTGAANHQLIYGIDLKRTESQDLREGSEINRVTGAALANSENFPLSDFPDPVTEQYALFVQDSIELGRWALLPGLRYDHYRLKPHVTREYLNGNRSDSDPSDFSDGARQVGRASGRERGALAV